jgi:hypothetical protein
MRSSAAIVPSDPDGADGSPHVGCYVAVRLHPPESRRAVFLEAWFSRGPRSAGDIGFTATVQDPTGGVLSLWQLAHLVGASHPRLFRARRSGTS